MQSQRPSSLRLTTKNIRKKYHTNNQPNLGKKLESQWKTSLSIQAERKRKEKAKDAKSELELLREVLGTGICITDEKLDNVSEDVKRLTEMVEDLSDWKKRIVSTEIAKDSQALHANYANDAGFVLENDSASPKKRKRCEEDEKKGENSKEEKTGEESERREGDAATDFAQARKRAKISNPKTRGADHSLSSFSLSDVFQSKEHGRIYARFEAVLKELKTIKTRLATALKGLKNAKVLSQRVSDLEIGYEKSGAKSDQFRKQLCVAMKNAYDPLFCGSVGFQMERGDDPASVELGKRVDPFSPKLALSHWDSKTTKRK